MFGTDHHQSAQARRHQTAQGDLGGGAPRPARAGTHRSRLLSGRVAGQGHQILERVLGVEMWRVPDGCVGEVGGGCLWQDGRGRKVQGRGWVGAPCDACGQSPNSHDSKSGWNFGLSSCLSLRDATVVPSRVDSGWVSTDLCPTGPFHKEPGSKR